MVLKPGLHGVVFALPGMLVSAWFALIAIAGYATGMPLGLAAGVFGIALACGVFWLPVVLYLVGTRLTLDGDMLELRQLFGLWTKRIRRAEIGRVAVAESSVASEGRQWSGIPVSYYDVLDDKGKRWIRLRSWVWVNNDCRRLRDEIVHPGSASVAATAPRLSIALASDADRNVDSFPSFLQSAGWVVQGCSMLFGFGLAMVVVAGVFSIPMGRELGADSVPGALIGAAIGSAGLMSGQIYTVLKDQKTHPFVAKLIALLSMLVIPVIIWVAVLFVFSAVLTILRKTSG